MKYKEIEKKVEQIAITVSEYMISLPFDVIKKEIFAAYEFARDAHEGQNRLSGEPYIIHPVEATEFLLNIKPDIYTIQACLLHDVIEDTPKTYEDIETAFCREVADLCEGMEKLSKVRYRGEDRTIASLRKMFVSMNDDLRVVFIKLADRLHNMKTLSHHPKPEKRERIALETLNIYAPIADRLGLYYFKNGLDEECFKILYNEEYKNIIKQLKELEETNEFFKNNAKNEIELLLGHLGIKYEISFRIKSLYSIYKKMERKQYESVKDLYDLYGIRIIVENVEDCYKVLGLIHNKWVPIPKKIKDYIALPKPNGYKSIHTTVIGLLKDYRKIPTEIQIKTFDMLNHSEIGIAAHFEYKERGSVLAQDIEWIKYLKELTESLENDELIKSLKGDVFKDRIFVLTPTGESKNLPAGSTVIDFAYDVHTDLGNHIYLSKVNGKVFPLDKPLMSGDVVEIFTDKTRTPNPFRISFVKTSKAKDKIKSFLRNVNKDLHKDRGREIINNLLIKAKHKKLDKDLSILSILDGKRLNMEERYQILEQVGNFSLPATVLIKKVIKEEKLENTKKTISMLDKLDSNHLKQDYKIIIGGEPNLPYRKGTCFLLNARPNKIVAHINTKGQISVHDINCKTVKKVNPDRLISACYEGEENMTIKFHINFVFENKIGILKDLTDILFKMNIDILELNSKLNFSGEASFSFKLEILDNDYLIIDRFLERVKFSLGNKLKDFSIKMLK